MIVVGASSWVLALVESGQLGDAARQVLTVDRDWMAPPHAPIEVLRTIRRYEMLGVLNQSAASELAGEIIRAEIRLVVPTLRYSPTSGSGGTTSACTTFPTWV